MNLKVGFFTALTSGVLLLSACGGGADDDHGMSHENSSGDEIKSLEASLEVPETVEAGETAEFIAHVTSNDEDVTDADKVVFEVKKDEESIEKIEAEHSEAGAYMIDYTFDEPGDYVVISHVDAFSLHTMPQEEVTVE
ncbi:FixH family protein [Salinicoccus siamensis]|uniref:FixH family protein n=1 Tax=Salinicoccus siamensis TaxID=381830 RepID=A0ABV5Z1I6_9STAP